jgi:hypothetical protein
MAASDPPPNLRAFWEAAASLVAVAGGAEVTDDQGHVSRVQLPFVSVPMRLWQRDHYSCGQACCFVSHCGQATCGSGASPNCTKFLTPTEDGPLPTHFACMECPPSLLVCESCFFFPSWLHLHGGFVRVSPSGEHSVVQRSGGLATARPLAEAESLPFLPLPPGEEQQQECAVCGEPLGEGPGFIPGCPAFHHGMEEPPYSLPEQRVCRRCVLGDLKNRDWAYTLELAAGGGPPPPHPPPPTTPCLTCSLRAEAAVYRKRCRRARGAARAAWCAAPPGAAAWEAAVSALAPLLSLQKWRAEDLQQQQQHAAAPPGPEAPLQAWERLLKAASAHFQNMHPQATIKVAGKEGLLGLPPGKLPPPLQASDGGFTLDTLVRRVPAILRETLKASQAPPALAAAVEAQLCGPLAGGALLPPPPEGGGESLWLPAAQASTASSSFWYQENATYRHLLHLWALHGLPGVDPFSAQKAEALAAARAPFCASLSAGEGSSSSSSSSGGGGGGGGAAAAAAGSLTLLESALLRSLWGNRADLSLSAGKVLSGGGHGEEASLLLCNDTSAACAHLLEGGAGVAGKRVTIVLDNCGLELLHDLGLADALLALGAVVTLHAKRWPTFVSDAIVPDIMGHIEWLSGETCRLCPAAGALAARLGCALQQGTLVLSSSAFWNSARPAWCMPPDLEEFFSSQDLAIFKGDANYRRLLGDLHWKPHSVPFSSIVGNYTPCPLLALRTAKAGLAVGISADGEQRAAKENPSDWLTCGKFGLIQFTRAI